MKYYTPLDASEIQNFTENVINELIKMPVSPLETLDQAVFEGAGVYVIYYTGYFKPYINYRNDIDNNTFDKPIYIGKAIPSGSRKGNLGLHARPGRALHKRLKEHLASLRCSNNLDSKDFYFRYLAIDDIWIQPSELLLIRTFLPIWNSRIDGFGNHTPGEGRFNQKRSSWDEIHPGRPWAARCQPAAQTSEQILARLKNQGSIIENIES